MAIDHDQIFKQLVEMFFREFMELFCPAEAALIDFDRVEFLREEFFTDAPSGHRRRLDLVVKVGLKSGGEKFVLIHVEFESSRKDENFPQRMFQYFCQLYLRYQADVVPVAMFTDDAHWRADVPDYFEVAVAGTRVVRFDYRRIKLKHLDYRAFLDSDDPLAYALMAKMDYDRKQRVRLKADFLRLITGCGVDPARESLLAQFIETYMPLTPSQEIEFQELVTTDQAFEKVETMITTYELRGIEKGRVEGRVEGQAEMLFLQLEKRFGPLDESIKQRVREIRSPEKLESLLLAVLDAQSLEDMQL